MGINKRFIKLLTEEKLTMFFDLIGEEGLKMIIPGKKTLKSLDDLDGIFYTIDFLKKEKLITVEEAGNIKAPHVLDCLQGGFKNNKRFISHASDIREKLKKYYKIKIKINPVIYDFIKNGYKTDLQKDRRMNFWLPILIAIGTVIALVFIERIK